MIVTKQLAYTLTQPDSGGMYDEVVGYAATLKLAKEWVAASTGWPRSYSKTHISVKIAETLSEVKKSSVEM